jgi:hypothetical protein
MNDGEIAAIRARLRAVSVWPWSTDYKGCLIKSNYQNVASAVQADSVQAIRDADFIAHAPVDIACLLDEVARLRTEAARLRQSIERLRIENERLENELRTARAEATSVRPGPCVPEHERPYDDETMFVEDAAPPHSRGGEKGP